MQEKRTNFTHWQQCYKGSHYYSFNQYLREQFGEKVYKIALDGGMTCPNRDGTIGYGGCIFCSRGGSGDFAEKMKSPVDTQDNVSVEKAGEHETIHVPGNSVEWDETVQVPSVKADETGASVRAQIEAAKLRIRQKSDARLFVAYYQSYTNTYAPAAYLRSLFTAAINHPDIVALSIGTRPDCLPEEVLALLSELNRIKPVWVELGLQTVHEDTAKLIRRGYPLSVYENAVKALHDRNISVITHVILGLPGEDEKKMLETVRYLAELYQTEKTRIGSRKNPMDNAAMQAPVHDLLKQNNTAFKDGIKLQLLHVLRNTDLADLYLSGAFRTLELEDYLNILCEALKIIPEDMVIHRLTGDGPKKILIAPTWSGNKKMVLNSLQKKLREENIFQGMNLL